MMWKALIAVALTCATPIAAYAKDEVISIGPMAMHPDGSSSATTYFVSWPGQLTGNGCYNTDVQLPLGVTLKSITSYSTSTVGGIYIDLIATTLKSGTTTTIKDFDVEDTSNSRISTTKTIPGGKADVKSGVAYGLGVCLEDGDKFHGVKIEYTVQ